MHTIPGNCFNTLTSMIMRKLLLSFLFVVTATGLFAGNGSDISYEQVNSSKARLTFGVMEYQLNNATLNGEIFTTIDFESSIATKDRGFAELPFLSTNIQLSANKNVDINVVDAQYEEIQLTAPLKPSRGVIYRDQNPESIPYTIDPSSIKDEWYPKALAEQKEPFIIRDIRGTSIMVYPFRYNAATQTLRVYTSVTIEVTENNEPATNPLQKASSKYYREMNGIYNSMFINYNIEKQDLTVDEAGDILVFTTERDVEAIQPWVQWKMEKGFEVFVEVVATGTNVVDLIQTKYDENPEILYVQLVGDWADIKVGTLGGAPTDPMAGCVVGTDVFQDICVGRFSASSAAEVTAQVNKTIQYEKNPQVDGEWYSAALGIGSSEGASNGDDSEMDKEHIQIIYDNRLDPFTYDTYYPNYDPGANSSTVASGINSGVSWINYCGHGSNTSWVTSGFNNNNVNALTNGDMLPGIISVACVNGAYHSGTCFAEAWLRKADGGAIATLMSTINQPWQPPMRGQDYINDILIGGYDYDNNPGNGINNSEQRTTFGSIAANGMVLMYSEAQGSDDLETIKTWILFGDASVQMRTAAPAPLELSNTVMLLGTPFAATVTSDGSPVANALVAISQEDLIYSVYTDENGDFSIENELQPGDVKLVVTAFNTETIYETISCIPPDGPYVIFAEKELNDNNANGMLEYGESATVNISMQNVGVEAAENVTVTITTADEYVTITDDEATFGEIPEGATVMIEDAFAFEAATDIPDDHAIMFNLVSTDGTETWESKFTIKGYAPVMQMSNMTINDVTGNNNGRLDAGETADLIIAVNNMGHAASQDIISQISTTSQYVTIDNANAACDPVDPEGTGTLTFTISVDEETPIGTVADIIFSGECGAYQMDHTYYATMGLVLEDFETGDFSSFDWEFSGASDWTIETSNTYEGAYCAKSGTIADQQTTSMTLDYTVMTDDTISFYYKVSSEGGYDYLRFYIDGALKGEWAGEVAWTQFKTPVTEGQHTFKWEYYKDYMVSSGSDCAWVDYIILPAEMRTVVYAGDDAWSCDGEAYMFEPMLTNYSALTWSSSGTGTFDDATIENATYTPSQEDIENGHVMITLEVMGNDDEMYTDELTLQFGMIPQVEAGDDGEICGSESFSMNSVITYYETVEWTSSGDGVFDDANSVEATYTPGELDIENGTVALSVMAFSGCGNVSDFVTLTVNSGPEVPAAVNGVVDVCGGTAETYSSDGSVNAVSYRWSLKPAEAGMINENQTSVTVNWATDFNGDAELKLIATNECGDTDSEPVMVAVHALPAMPAAIHGIDSVDVYKESTSAFTIDELVNTTGYNFTMEPVEAGTMEMSETNVTVTWNPDFVGNAFIRACGMNECGEGSYSQAKTVKVYNSVGINEVLATLWAIYPNPAQNELYIDAASIDEAYTVTIYNTVGAVMMSHKYDRQTSGNVVLDVSLLENGVYFVSVKTEEGSSMKKVMINR